MKLMIASDLHGSAYFTRKLMEACQAERPSKLLTMGTGTPCPGNMTVWLRRTC